MCDPFQPPAMSGEIFQPLETFEEQVESGRGPLTCRLCTQQYEDPRILNCHHVFCGNCLRGRAVDGFMTCPLCGTRSFLTNGSNLPQADPVINFLLKSSEQERALCANCDTMQSSMFFCNTCNQALCALCKEETHMAKMFASHQVVSLKKRTSEQHRKCAKHNDEYIMYSTEKQELLCIKCFRDFEKDDRAFCLDLESAYKQSCRQLEERISTIRDLQSSVHDAIILFQALMQEVRSNGEKERVSIQELCAEMQERMVEKKEELLKDVDSQQLQKEQAFKDQLPSLAALLPALQTNLAISTMFVSGANMYEFLDLSSSLNERLASIANQPHQLRPQESGEISTDYEAKFARCLQPLLHIHLDNCDDCGSSSPIIHVSMPTTSAPSPQQQPPARREHPAPQPLSSAYISSALARHLSLTNTLQDPLAGKGLRRGSKMAASIRHRLQEGNGPFVEHCKAFEANFRLLQHRIQKMKEQVQEIHRDITRRKCLAKKEKVTDVLDECSQVEIQIGTHTATLEHMKVIFQKIWQEMLDRVSSEQEIYQNQLKDMNYLKQENSHLATIARQIAPYITSIDAVTKQIDPRSRSASPHESEDEGSEGNPLHITKLVLTSNTKNSITDSAERDPDTSPSQSLVPPDGDTDASHDTPSAVSHDVDGSHDVLFQGDGAEAKKAFHRTLSEQEEYERLRAKKIVMDAIMSEQCKEALKDSGVSKGPEPDLPCGSGQRPQATCSNGVEDDQKCLDADRRLTVTKLDLDDPCGSTQRPQSGKCLEEPKSYADADRHVKVTNSLDTEHSCGSGQGPKAEQGAEETQKCGKADRLLKVVDVNGSSSDSSHDLGIKKQRVKRERLGDEGIVQTTVTEADAEEGSVSVSSRVKRFSLSDDQVEMAQKQQAGACPGSPRPPPRAQKDAKRVVVKPNDAEVKQRSVMSVTVTTSEDTSSTHTSTPTSIEHSKGKGPVTDETENIVLRVRNRRKLREQATLANNS
ncbi:RING finger protein 207 [Strongylocentrotus purpuratus]|uniref:RING finger protein 207 n=1 Tax=Strongylocentrotus purpuratus TaxID=7668 RepID=A0A7M7NYI0_STRPU|nr:RING finger protein 207 [Strongylocentrotus purpuratus]